VETVIVNGQLVVDEGQSVLVDEKSLLQESRDYAVAFSSEARQLAGEAEKFRPYIEQAYLRSLTEPIPDVRSGSTG
jgi:hypothetical protein